MEYVFSYYGDTKDFNGSAKEILTAIEKSNELPATWDMCTLAVNEKMIACGEIAVFATLKKLAELNMKIYEKILNLKNGETYISNGPMGITKIRRTKCGCILSNSCGSFYIKEKNIENSIGNYNSIGLAGQPDYASISIHKA